ncbi:MAG TPA: hypothetical protein PLV42_09700 [bacterium]|nr:hypothetical protein [bacterium]
MTKYLFILLAAFVLCVGCETCASGDDEGCAVLPPDKNAVDNSTVDDDAAITDDIQPVAFEGRTSACGGFEPEKAQVRMAASCDETLNWSYDPETQRLTVRHEDIVLNCGAEGGLETEAIKDEAGYKIIEWELPHGAANCICSFDYETVLLGIESGVVPVTVVRHVVYESEDKGETAVWSGSFDLSQGSGTIPIPQENCP